MEHKGYYAIIPADVRYDTDVIPSAKLLYGEITALCNQEGFCWASNDYFAELYDVSKRTISRWISALENKKYVLINYQYKSNTKMIERRCISLPTYRQKCPDVVTKTSRGYRQKRLGGIDKNVLDNNTKVNNTVNNTLSSVFVSEKKESISKTEIETFFQAIWNAYPKKEGKGNVSATQKKKLYEIGLDEMMRAIERYNKKLTAENTELRFIKQGSTFFNSGYVDYIDANYQEPKHNKKNANSSLDMDEIEQMIRNG